MNCSFPMCRSEHPRECRQRQVMGPNCSAWLRPFKGTPNCATFRFSKLPPCQFILILTQVWHETWGQKLAMCRRNPFSKPNLLAVLQLSVSTHSSWRTEHAQWFPTMNSVFPLGTGEVLSQGDPPAEAAENCSLRCTCCSTSSCTADVETQRPDSSPCRVPESDPGALSCNHGAPFIGKKTRYAPTRGLGNVVDLDYNIITSWKTFFFTQILHVSYINLHLGRFVGKWGKCKHICYTSSRSIWGINGSLTKETLQTADASFNRTSTKNYAPCVHDNRNDFGGAQYFDISTGISFEVVWRCIKHGWAMLVAGVEFVPKSLALSSY